MPTDLTAELRDFRAAARARPRSVEDVRNLGVMLTHLGELREGESVLRHALALDPRDSFTRFSLGVCLLTAGRMVDGWRLYGARENAVASVVALPRDIPMPRWLGEPLAGRHVLILPEQGYGDQIQFVRFVPDLVEMGARVTLVAHAPLAGLFQTSLPNVEVVAATTVEALPEADFWTSLFACYDPARRPSETLWRGPYLSTRVCWTTAPEGRLIGIVTAGNMLHPNNAYRSLPPALAQSLRERLPGRVIGLDPTITKAPSFSETAAIIDRLDEVVAVDTAAAHLAGAMGKSCRLLLPGRATDWRWLQGRADTPWYAGHRLYRGDLNGDWTEAIDRMISDLGA